MRIIKYKILFISIFILFSILCFSADKSLNIAMVLWRGETNAEQGFKDRLAELGYHVNYTLYNADQDRTKLGLILRKDFTSKLETFDYVYSFGTTATQMTKFFVKNRIPHVFNIVTAPVEAGIVKSLISSGENISGTTHNIPLELQIKSILEVKNVKKLGLFFNPREDNSKIIMQQLKSVCKDYNINLVTFRTAPDVNSLNINLQKLIDKEVQLDAIYFPMDSFMISNSAIIGEKIRQAKLIGVGAQRGYIDDGLLIGLTPNYYELGTYTADIIDQNYNGKSLQDIPIVRVKNPIYIVNETTRKFLDISIPDKIIANSTIVE